jgi:hypothetical protein
MYTCMDVHRVSSDHIPSSFMRHFVGVSGNGRVRGRKQLKIPHS